MPHGISTPSVRAIESSYKTKAVLQLTVETGDDASPRIRRGDLCRRGKNAARTDPTRNSSACASCWLLGRQNKRQSLAPIKGVTMSTTRVQLALNVSDVAEATAF
jgi:hypothetical protein